MLYAVTRPVKFKAEATFREKGKANDNNKGIESLFMSPSQLGESEAVSLLKSRTILEDVIKKMGLQAQTTELQTIFQPIKDLVNNFIVELAYFTRNKNPSISQSYPSLQFRDVDYDGDHVRSLQIVFNDKERYTIYEKDGTLIGEGFIGKPVRYDDFAMTIVTAPGKEHQQTYNLKILPMYLTVDNIKGDMKIYLDKEDKKLVNLSYAHTNRNHSIKVLDQVMASYQSILGNEDNRYANLQLDYLRKRHNETFDKQARVMKDYADELANDLSHTGYTSSENELAFLAKIHHEYHEELMKIELSLKHLEDMVNNDAVLTKNHYGVDFNSINQFIQELEAYKQQRDSLAIALRQKILLDTQNINMEFEHQIVNLDQMKKDSHEISKLIAQMESDEEIDKDTHVFNDKSLLVRAWIEKAQEAQEAYIDASQDKSAALKTEWDTQKNNALSYLRNLLKLNETHAQVIKERLSNHYDPKSEYNGLDLDTARQLYLSYCKDVGLLEAEIRQNAYIIKELEDPNFEVNSLSSIVKDPIAQEIVNKSSELALSLRDEDNRSSREIARTKEELAFQKRFLSEHLRQTNIMLELRKNLLEEKLYSLQGVTMELIHQKITIIQKQIHDFISSKIASLELEKKLYEKNLAEVNRKMAMLPSKWVSEQILNQNLVLNKSIVEEITKMVESKNISNHMEVIKSSPVDSAFAAPRPIYPKIVIFTVLGAFAGFVFSLGYFVIQAMFNGVRASEQNLRDSGQYVAGTLTLASSLKPYTDQDLDALRKILYRYRDEKKLLLLLNVGKGIDYSLQLADLFKMTELSVVCISACFDNWKENQLPGLLQVLEGKTDNPRIVTHEEIDCISSGGISRYTSELLSSDRFLRFLNTMQKQYDVVCVVSNVALTTGEAQGLFNLFNNIVVSITDENLLDLKTYIEAEKNKKITFVMSRS
jgi:uncharacterized protein involved in exopolysaccharide biosynthesis